MENLPDPATLIVLLGTLGMLPFLIVMGTCFVKLAVVFALVRNALGIQSIPPNMALHGLALVLTIYIMMPVGMESYDNLVGQHFELDNTSTLEAGGLGRHLSLSEVPHQARQRKPDRFLRRHGRQAVGRRVRTRTDPGQPVHPDSGIRGGRTDHGVRDRLSHLSAVHCGGSRHLEHPVGHGDDDALPR